MNRVPSAVLRYTPILYKNRMNLTIEVLDLCMHDLTLSIEVKESFKITISKRLKLLAN